jgi:hypothetical protein
MPPQYQPYVAIAGVTAFLVIAGSKNKNRQIKKEIDHFYLQLNLITDQRICSLCHPGQDELANLLLITGINNWQNE